MEARVEDNCTRFNGDDGAVSYVTKRLTKLNNARKAALEQRAWHTDMSTKPSASYVHAATDSDNEIFKAMNAKLDSMAKERAKLIAALQQAPARGPPTRASSPGSQASRRPQRAPSGQRTRSRSPSGRRIWDSNWKDGASYECGLTGPQIKDCDVRRRILEANCGVLPKDHKTAYR